jgi:hypothetical protein
MSDDKKFKAWWVQANAECLKITGGGLDLRDLPDVDYREYFEDGMSPRDAAEIAIEEAGGGDLLDG